VFLPSPTCPHGGDTPLSANRPLVQQVSRGSIPSKHPRLRSVLWLARRGGRGSAVLAKNLPQRSRANELTDGRVKFVKNKSFLLQNVGSSILIQH
jgi:hypothetical protein